MTIHQNFKEFAQDLFIPQLVLTFLKPTNMESVIRIAKRVLQPSDILLILMACISAPITATGKNPVMGCRIKTVYLVVSSVLQSDERKSRCVKKGC